MEVYPLKNMSRGVFGGDLRQSVIRAVKGVLQKMQYDVYDPVTDVTERASRIPSLFSGTLEVVRKTVQASGLGSEDVGPARVSCLDSIVAPYAHCREKPHTIGEISVSDVPALFEGAIRLGTQEAGRIFLGQMAVRTVFGASESTPVRALSYLLPGLHLVEAMRRSNKFSQLPQIQYVVMGETATRMNGLSKDDVRRNVDLLIGLGDAYVDRYYPELAKNVVFARDDEFLDHPEVNQLREVLQRSDSVGDHPLFLPVSQDLDQFGTTNAYEYAALHPLVHDITYEINPFTVANGDEALIHSPDLLINIGGQREKIFYKARMMFRDALARQGFSLIPSVQLFSCHKAPPYAPIRADGDRLSDITFDDVVVDPSSFFMFDVALNKDAVGNNLLSRDYRLLYKDSPFHDFPYFLNDALSDIRNNRQEDTN